MTKRVPPPVVFVKGAPDEYDLLQSGIFCKPGELQAMSKFAHDARLSGAAAVHAVPDYLGREPTHDDFVKKRAEFLKAWDGHVIVAVGKSARDLLGERAHLSLLALDKSEECVRKAKALRRLLDDYATSCDIGIKLASAYVPAEPRREGGTYVTDRLVAEIHKASEEEQRIVYGVVLDPYAPDAHDDWIPPGEIEKTAREFMKKSRVISLQHEELTDAKVVESFVEIYPSKSDRVKALRKEPHRAYKRHFGNDVIHSGSWVLGVELTPELWQQFKQGKFAAFSIEGYAIRVPTTTAAMPRVNFIEIGQSWGNQ
jgi:hypothetical protein